MNDTDQTPAEPIDPVETGPARIECRAASEPAIRPVVFAALLIGFGIWCLLDRHNYPYKPGGGYNVLLPYLLNTWGPILFLPLGLLFLWKGIRAYTRVLVADEEGIGYAGKPRIAWADVKRLDAADLKNEILLLDHGDGGALKLDGYNLRDFRDLVAFIEKRIPEDKWVRPDQSKA